MLQSAKPVSPLTEEKFRTRSQVDWFGPSGPIVSADGDRSVLFVSAMNPLFPFGEAIAESYPCGIHSGGCMLSFVPPMRLHALPGPGSKRFFHFSNEIISAKNPWEGRKAVGAGAKRLPRFLQF